MYLQYYGLTEAPFTLNPDPGFLYLGETHQAAYSRMEYGLLNQAPFCVLTGDVGIGKTVIIRHLINQIQGDKHYTVGFMTNTQSTAQDLLRWILFTFKLDCPEDDKAKAHQIFYDFLINEYANNRQVVLIVDEAQNLDVETLERLRLLSNINADKHQVLQTFLVGQEGLQEMLNKPELKQFAQRITYSYHLEPFSRLETHAYILHRLSVAGGKNRQIFSIDACDRVFHYSQGTPRLINALCDTALVYGFSDEVEQIGSDIIEAIVQDKRKGHILPISEQAFVQEEGVSSEIEALYTEIDRNIDRQVEVASSKVSEQTEIRLPEPKLNVTNQESQDELVEQNQAEPAEIFPVAETKSLHKTMDLENQAAKEDPEINIFFISWLKDWKERYGFKGYAGLLFLVVLGAFFWNLDTNNSDYGTESQVGNNDIDNYNDAEINTNQAGLSGSSEETDDSEMITVEVDIPEQTESGNNIAREENSIPLIELEKADEQELIAVRTNINKTIVEIDNNTPSTERVVEVETTIPVETSEITEQESVTDSSIEQVKSFFQLLTPKGEAAEDETQSGGKVRVLVKQGDTLTKILRKVLGEYDKESLNKVLRENPGIEDADRIYIGQVIYISKE